MNQEVFPGRCRRGKGDSRADRSRDAVANHDAVGEIVASAIGDEDRNGTQRVHNARRRRTGRHRFSCSREAAARISDVEGEARQDKKSGLLRIAGRLGVLANLIRSSDDNVDDEHGKKCDRDTHHHVNETCTQLRTTGLASHGSLQFVAITALAA